MIRKSGSRFSEKIMLKQKIQRGMTIRRKVIPIERLKVGCNVSLRRTRPDLGEGARRGISRSGRAPPVRRTHRRRIQAAAADERRISAAARLYAAHRHSLWHAVVGAA